MARPTWSRSYAKEKRLSWWAEGTPPDKQRFFFRRRRARCTCWCARAQLSDTMSRYLIQRIEENPAIELHYKTEIVGLEGDTHLEQRHLAGQDYRRDFSPRHSPRLHHGGSVAANRMAARLRRAR